MQNYLILQKKKYLQQQKINNFINISFCQKMSSRICLKRKQAVKKCSLGAIEGQFVSQNAQVQKSQGLVEISNSSIVSKPVIQDHGANQRLFEEFKIQYDQLRHAYQAQRLAFDELSQQKKRLEIQVLNNNPEFYEKQIKRLRAQVEKLQQQNQDNKHKFIMAENVKKQLQATVKVRNQELKKTIQLLQKQKVSTVELKHQIVQKQKLLHRITGEMQKSSNVLSQSFEDANARIQKLQLNLKNKTKDYQGLQRNYDHLAKKLAETERAMKANKQIFDQTNFKKSQIIDDLETKLRNLNRTSRDTIEGLQVKIQQIKNQRKTENLLINEQIQTRNNFKQQRINQLQIVRLEQNYKELKLDYENKCKIVKSLEQKLLVSYSQEQYLQLEKKYKDLESKSQKVCKQFHQKLLKAQKQLQTLKISQFRNPGIEQGVTQNFQELLKVQLDQNSKLKRELSLKIDQVYNVKADLDELKCKLRTNEDQISILNKKLKSQYKNHKIESDVTTQNLKNQIDSLKRKLDMAQVKIDQKAKQIKQKQNFIMNTIIGRSRQQDVPLIMAQLQRIFESNYVTRLNAALQKLQQNDKIEKDKKTENIKK